MTPKSWHRFRPRMDSAVVVFTEYRARSAFRKHCLVIAHIHRCFAVGVSLHDGRLSICGVLPPARVIAFYQFPEAVVSFHVFSLTCRYARCQLGQHQAQLVRENSQRMAHVALRLCRKGISARVRHELDVSAGRQTRSAGLLLVA